MANSGYKQAVIAYKVSKPDGEPLDINGNLTRITGRKQAIALLSGYVNPDPSKYEVEFYYSKNGVITGNPSITYDVQSCPVGYLRVSPTRIILDPDNLTALITLESSNRWVLLSGPTNYVTLDFTAGSAGIYNIEAKGVTFGGGTFIFKNTVTLQEAAVYILYVAEKPWILDTGYWNNLGFWYDNGIWKFQ